MIKAAQRSRPRGRPEKPASERAQLLGIRFPPALLEQIDGEVAARIDGADRSSVIRELVVEALTARQSNRKGKR